MKPDDIRRLFPNASASLLAANAQGALLQIEESKGGKVDALRPELERNSRNGAVGKGKAKGRDSRRFLVRVTSVRCRLLDEDNICEKYVVDCCRYAGVLPGDGPGQTHIQVGQRKAGKEEVEHTLIEVFEIISP